MPTVHLVRHTAVQPDAVWAELTDFGAHGRWMPLTTMRLDEGSPRLGWCFAGLTGVGPLRFSDPMVVTGWRPPSESGPHHVAELRLVKTGSLLGGWVRVTIEEHGGGSRVVWHEQLTIRPLPDASLTEPLLARAATWLYARALDGMLGQATSAATHRAGVR